MYHYYYFLYIYHVLVNKDDNILYNRSYCLSVLHWVNRDFSDFLLLWPWPWPDNLHIRTWPVSHGYIAADRKWAFYVKAFDSYRMTYIQTYSHRNYYHAASRVVKMIIFIHHKLIYIHLLFTRNGSSKKRNTKKES